jgi:aryl-alcohol dehydrogenase-like predicted oxidoreductase
MKYKGLGSSGVKVSELCLGTMYFGSKVDEVGAKKIVQRAVDRGINFIDTANVYVQGKSEEIVGWLIKTMRKDIELAIKVRHSVGPGPNDEGLSREHIMQAIDDSLKRLGTD